MITSYNVDLKSLGFSTLDKYIKSDHTKYLSQISPYTNVQEYNTAVEKAKVYISDKEVATVICEQSHIDNNTLLRVPVIINKRQDNIVIHTYSNRYPILSEPRPVLGGEFQVGDTVWNTDLSRNKCLGWVCVESGSPGKWLEQGQLRSWYNEVESMTYLPQASELQFGRQILLKEDSGNSSLWICKKVHNQYEWTQQDYAVGTTEDRPRNPHVGLIRFNTDIHNLEWWSGEDVGWISTVSQQYLKNLDMGHLGDNSKRTFAIVKGTTAQCREYTGVVGELVYDTDKNILYSHDGKTKGGIPAIMDLTSVLNDIKSIKSRLDTAESKITSNTNRVTSIETDLTYDERTGVTPKLSVSGLIDFKVGKGAIMNEGGHYDEHDYSDRMQDSIVKIDHILGVTENRHGRLWNVDFSNIASYSPGNIINVFSSEVFNNAHSIYTFNGTILDVTSTESAFGYVQFDFAVTEFTNYMLVFDCEELSGNSWVSVSSSADESEVHVITDIKYSEGNSAIFNTGPHTHIYIKFYSNVHIAQPQKVVRYSNCKLIKVNDYCKNQVKLRGLPNGIHDTYENGMVNRRIRKHTLNGQEGWVWSDSSQPNTNAFMCKLPYSINAPDKQRVCLNSNRYECMSDSDIYLSDRIGLAIGGDNGQLVFRTGKWCDSVTKLIDHLTNKEPDITIEYECKNNEENYPTTEEVDLSLVAKSGDHIYIGSLIRPTEIYQTVQLTTKAQIVETQKSVGKLRRSFLDKVRKLFDGDYYIKDNFGFIKLPTLLGGLILQWGYNSLGTTQFNYIIADVPYVINFPNQCNYAGMGYIRSTNSAQDLYGNAVGIGEYGRNGLKLHVRNSTGNNITGEVTACWFAIGK